MTTAQPNDDHKKPGIPSEPDGYYGADDADAEEFDLSFLDDDEEK